MEVVPPDFSYLRNASALSFNASNYIVSVDGNHTEGNGLRLLFQLKDVRANQSIPFVTYWINITRVSSNGSSIGIMNEFFQVPSAQPLILNVQQPSWFEQKCRGGAIDAGTCDFRLSPYHVTQQNLVIHASPVPLLDAWMQGPDGKIQIDSSDLLQSGKYSAKISIVSAYNAKTLFSEQTTPKFEKSWTLAANSAVVPEFPSNLLVVGLAPVIAVILALSHRYMTRNRSTP